MDVSPDGRTLVFDVLGDLYTVPIDGGKTTRIVGGLSFESQPPVLHPMASIAFLSDRTGVEALWMADADGSNPKAVSKDGRARPPTDHGVAQLDMNGQYLVVSKSRPPDPGTFWLFLYHRDGGNGVRIGRRRRQPARRQGPPPPPPR